MMLAVLPGEGGVAGQKKDNRRCIRKVFEMNSKTTPELARRNLRLFGRLVIGNFRVNINLEAETTFQESFYRMASYSNEVYIFPE